MTNILTAHNISKFYKLPESSEKISILENINFNLNSGEIKALVGPSGSGKTTLLNILGLLDTISSGELLFNNININKLNTNELSSLRGENLGFVFQFHHLLPDFTALENVMLPLFIKQIDTKQAKKLATEILEKIGLSHRLKSYPSQLSGGEQQRVSIARALVSKPKLLIADEPTGNLDKNNALEVFKMLMDLVKNNNTAMLIATHDSNIFNLIENKITIENKTLTPLNS
jgi:lipoprotein-releasing system ATP-binding protein